MGDVNTGIAGYGGALLRCRCLEMWTRYKEAWYVLEEVGYRRLECRLGGIRDYQL